MTNEKPLFSLKKTEVSVRFDIRKIQRFWFDKKSRPALNTISLVLKALIKCLLQSAHFCIWMYSSSKVVSCAEDKAVINHQHTCTLN